MDRNALKLSGMLLLAAILSPAWADDCPAPSAPALINMPGAPFGVTATSDRCWAFVTVDITDKQGAIVVLRNDHGNFKQVRDYALAHAPYGASLTDDGRLLAIATDADVTLLDVTKLESEKDEPRLGQLVDGKDVGFREVAISHDQHTLFASEELSKRIAVFDLAKAQGDAFRSNDASGHVPAGIAPVGLAMSADGQTLYAVSEAAPPALKLPTTCEAENSSTNKHAQGLLLRIDVATAATNPAKSIVAAVPAGCNPVRTVVSNDGNDVWVSARGENALIRLHAADLQHGNTALSTARIPVGSSPVGLAISPVTGQVWTANSDRFHKGGFTGIAGLLDTQGEVKSRQIAMEGFPRELAFLPGTDVLLTTLFSGRKLAITPLSPASHP